MLPFWQSLWPNESGWHVCQKCVLCWGLLFHKYWHRTTLKSLQIEIFPHFLHFLSTLCLSLVSPLTTKKCKERTKCARQGFKAEQQSLCFNTFPAKECDGTRPLALIMIVIIRVYCVCLCVQTCTCVRVCVCACMCVYTCMCACIRVCTCSDSRWVLAPKRW